MRKTAPLNRKYHVVQWLHSCGFTRKQAMKLWTVEIWPQINNDMDVKDIIGEIQNGWDELELEQDRETAKQSE